jgi:hypothetical protein
MKVTILTQNLASKNINNIPNDIFTDILGTTKPDIYVEFTQEDNRQVDEQTIIDKSVLEGYSNICVEALTPKQPFNIITKVYSNNDKIIKIQSGHLEINKFSGSFSSPLESSLGRLIRYATKGSSWVLIRDTSGGADTNILFVNMHLPIDTGKLSFIKNSSLGNKYRIESMSHSLKTILTHLKKTIDIKFLKVFIGGDLNFRIIDGSDQLSAFLEENLKILKNKMNAEDLAEKSVEKLSIPLFELSENLGSTCKYLSSCDADRTDNAACLDPERAPSRCDRILTNIPLSNLNILNQKNFVVDPSLDHNAIILSVELNSLYRYGISKSYPSKNTLNTGGKRYKKTRHYRKKSTTKVTRRRSV